MPDAKKLELTGDWRCRECGERVEWKLVDEPPPTPLAAGGALIGSVQPPARASTNMPCGHAALADFHPPADTV